MLHGLGNTRSSLKADHLLQTPDTFIRIPLPGANDVEFIVHIAPRARAAFTQMTAETNRQVPDWWATPATGTSMLA